ncbi:MAG: DUF4830 domain-containing protein [Ruminococcus sp.]|nr:DUF4830 domain-containing protein [Candidatus Copronaster equi]
MFVMSVKSSTVKTASIILAAIIAVTALVIFLPDSSSVAAGSIFEGADRINYDKIKTDSARKEFLSQFGWEIGECLEETEVKIPNDFDKIMNAYNELQKAQGLDLSEYRGKTAKRFTYSVSNYPEYDGKVLANMIVYKNRVIAGDICSSDVGGFIHGFEKIAD